jgi:hypothetical protein
VISLGFWESLWSLVSKKVWKEANKKVNYINFNIVIIFTDNDKTRLLALYRWHQRGRMMKIASYSDLFWCTWLGEKMAMILMLQLVDKEWDGQKSSTSSNWWELPLSLFISTLWEKILSLNTDTLWNY